ncbi:MAG: beta-galactosidase [Micrococcales bacterium]
MTSSVFGNSWRPAKLWFGGDYNPEQWPRSIWDEDMVLMQRAGVTVATVAVFAWAKLEPREGEFNFGWLDELLDLLHANSIAVDLATATAAPPAWMAKNHPDTLPVNSTGITLGTGSRQQYSPSSKTYARLAARLVTKMAERYGKHPAVVAWHLNNELGCHVAHSYDADSAAAFRVWLEKKYGSIDALNAAWNTEFWSQHYDNFEEINPPTLAPTFINPTELLDWDRFSSDALLEVYKREAAILREATPNIPLTTNFMGLFKHANYWQWAEEVDFVTDDSYPDPADPQHPAQTAATRDMMRSLANGKSWLLMEQAPNAVNWRPQNAAKPAGMNRLYSMQAMARGAEGIMYFQWRQSRAGAEKFHSGIIGHAGHETRVFRETAALGNELAGMQSIIGERQQAKVAIVFDWESWWAIEQVAGHTQLSYLGNLMTYYRPLFDANVLVDFVPAHADLSGYQLVIAPMLYIMDDAAQQNLSDYVAGGGYLCVSYQSGILDEHAGVHLGGYFGKLQETLGIWIEEFAPLAKPVRSSKPLPQVSLSGEVTGKGKVWTETIHLKTANSVAVYLDGPNAEGVAVTRNEFGKGEAWYVGTQPSKPLATTLINRLLADSGIYSEFGFIGKGIEVVRRGNLVFVMNHNDFAFDLPADLAARIGVAVEIQPYECLIGSSNE